MLPNRQSLTVVGLFAGIGGIELGLASAGHRTKLLCEIDPGAQRVLTTHFKTEIKADIRHLGPLPDVDILTAGFPCQDLSQAGRTAGIAGHQSGLVTEVFKRLGDRRRAGPRWLLFENVPFMLQLQRGLAMRYLVAELERLGFTWAYRVVDTRAFGIPQRRHRVLLLASRTEDPRPVLSDADAGEHRANFSDRRLCGFYWTEGSRGLGWAIDALPTLMGGSSIGIPSPPAIWDPLDGSITTPDLRDAERLQGFEPNWTAPAVQAQGVRQGHRWKLTGNAVSVPVAAWIGERLAAGPRHGQQIRALRIEADGGWPMAAWGHAGKIHAVDVSAWPTRHHTPALREYLQFPRTALSLRASAGFLGRAPASSLKFQPGFLEDVARHVERMRCLAAA